MRERPPAADAERRADADDVAAFRAGDGEAFARLVRRREAEVFVIARRMLGRREDAMDAVQDTFLRAYRGLPRFRGDAAFRTWLIGIAVNVCRSRLAAAARRGAARTGFGEAADGGPAWSDPPEPAACAPSPERQAYGGELRAALERALAALTADHREVLLLREMVGMDHGEIAAVLRCRVGTVKSRLNRARAALRRELEGVWP